MARTPKITTAPTGSIAPFGLRMLPELKEKIEEAARANGRSMNAEIVARLSSTFKDPPGERHPELEQKQIWEPTEDDLVFQALELERHAIDMETQGLMLKNGSLWDIMRWWPTYGKEGLRHVNLSSAREALDLNKQEAEKKRKESRALLERVKWFPKMWG